MSETATGPQQGCGGAWEESLKFEEVAKFFSLPIAEAASILGVCSSVLKKICRDNGVLRWPYRKFLAGKTVEEIKKDAARERNKELAELSKAARQRLDGSTTISSTSAVQSSPAMQTHPRLNILYQHTQLQNRTANPIQDTPKLQPGGPTPSHSSQHPENKLLQNGRHHMHHSGHTRGIPSYMDEFKHGFPKDGLSSSSVRWWGSSNGSSDTDKSVEEEFAPKDAAEQPVMLLNETGNHTAKNVNIGQMLPESDTAESFDTGSEAAVSLSRMRKRNADDGRAALKLGVTRGYSACRLGRRERMLLLRVFGKSSLPSHWRYSFS